MIIPLIILGFCILMFIITSVKQHNDKQSNSAFERKFINNGFIVDRKFEINDNLLLIDNHHKKWCVKYSIMKSAKVYDYKDLTEFILYEDGNSVMKSKRFDTWFWSQIYNDSTRGALIGMSTQRKVVGTCTDLHIRIRTTDFDNPEYYIPILPYEVKKTSIMYKNNFQLAQDVAATLAYIDNINDMETPA